MVAWGWKNFTIRSEKMKVSMEMTGVKLMNLKLEM